MSAIAKWTGTGAPMWLKYTGLALAGMASFWMALQWRAPESDSAVELRDKPARIQPTATAQPGSAQPATAASRSEVPSARLNADIVQNPFAPLNLLASMDNPPPPPVSAETQPKAKRKKVKPKPPEPPLVVPEVVVQAPAPTAPPLPFKVLGSIQGRQIAGGQTVVFLGEGKTVHVVHAGDELNQQYRVERITESRIDFTYLPLKALQTLPIAQ